MLRVGDYELDKAQEAVDVVSVRDVVTKESHVVQTSGFLDLSIGGSGPRYTLLVPASVIDQFCKDVLIKQLLDDAFTSLCLLLLLLATSSVRLL